MSVGLGHHIGFEVKHKKLAKNLTGFVQVLEHKRGRLWGV